MLTGFLPAACAQDWQEANQQGIESLLSGDYDGAESQFRSARRLAGDDPAGQTGSLSNLANVHVARAFQAEEQAKQAAVSRVYAVGGSVVFVLLALSIGFIVLKFFPVKPRWYKKTQDWVAEAKAKTPTDVKGTGFYFAGMFLAFTGAALLFLAGISSFMYVLKFAESQNSSGDLTKSAHYSQARQVLGRAMYGENAKREATTADVLNNYADFLRENGQGGSERAALVAERLRRLEAPGSR